MENAAKSERSVSPAIEAWRQLYDGELEAYSPSQERPEIRAVAVRRADFRAARGNWPKIFHSGAPGARTLVLIHGLKDSPGYLEDVALRFAAQGVNVALPLLPGHGRRDPAQAMRQADRKAWRSTVDRAVEIAAMLSEEVSIGGLSTGGALAVDKCLRDSSTIAGKVFLFSAALGLRPGPRLLLSTELVPRWLDAWIARGSNTGLGGNPTKYARPFFTGGRQVLRLIEEIQRRARSPTAPFAGLEHCHRLFVAHSEADRTIPVAAIRPLVRPEDPGQHHIIRRERNVAHAELVLGSAMTFQKRWPSEPAAPCANPEFAPMMQKALAFLDR